MKQQTYLHRLPSPFQCEIFRSLHKNSSNVLSTDGIQSCLKLALASHHSMLQNKHVVGVSLGLDRVRTLLLFQEILTFSHDGP